MITSAILQGLFTSFFVFSKNLIILIVTRVFGGFFQVMFMIYFPVWIDLCAPPKSQAMWISLLYSAFPLGVIIGAVQCHEFKKMLYPEKDSYKWGFLIQTALMVGLIGIAMILFPAHYYDKPKEQGEEFINIEDSQDI